MHVERLAKDKVRIFVSFDDLEERGIDRDEIWLNGKKMQELFWDMMETAYSEVGFEIAGPIAIEAFTKPSEGVVVIVTRVPSLPNYGRPSNGQSELEVELSDALFSSLVFSFSDFEDVIRAAHALLDYDLQTSLYEYKGRYQLFVDEDSVDEEDYDAIWSILHEYGEYSELTIPVLDEYANKILPANAVELLTVQFPL